MNFLDKLSKYEILLASKSPRRHEIFKLLNLKVRIIDNFNFNEKFPEDIPISDVAEFIAKSKAQQYQKYIKTNQILVTADTLVVLKNEILGKPKDLKQATIFLKKLSGKTHKVITGVSISTTDKNLSFRETTYVKFKKLSDDIINYYVEKYKPLDKAGAYGIQEWIGLIGIEKVVGCYFNVMGFPAASFMEKLKLFLENENSGN